MEHLSFLYSAISFFSILTLATLIHSLAKKTVLPSALLLLITGFLLKIASLEYNLDFHLIEFSPETVFYIFLPTLIFESAYHLNFRQFKMVLPEVLTLSIVGLTISMLIIGLGLHYILHIPLEISLLFGSFISATDPVAVLSIFKEMRVPKKLATIVDGESLLNDGTSLVLFQFLLGAILGSGIVVNQNLFFEGINLFKTIILGALVGIALGGIFSIAIAKSESKGVQLTLSIILAHVTFLISEGLMEVSGIIATMSAGIVMGNFGKLKLSKKTKKSFSEIWKFLEFISNSLVFILLGTKLAQIDILSYWKIIIISSVITLIFARGFSVLISLFTTNFFRKKEDKIKPSYSIVTIWGGIRGALAASAVLLIPPGFPFLSEIQAMTAGVIIASFLINTTTLPYLLKKLKLVQLSKTEILQRIEARIIINQKAKEHLKKMVERKYISKEIYEKLDKKYSRNQSNEEKMLQEIQSSLLKKESREIEKVLTHFALGIELKTYYTLFELNEISESRLESLSNSIYRQTDRLEKSILPEETKQTKSWAPQVPNLKKFSIKFIQNILERKRKNLILERWQHYRARKIASWRVILDFKKLKKTHDLFTDSEIVKKILKRYTFWNNNSEKKMNLLKDKFPLIINPFIMNMAENSCLKYEEEIEEEFLEKGLISEKVFENIYQEIKSREKKTT